MNEKIRVQKKSDSFILLNGEYKNNNLSVLALSHPAYIYYLFDKCKNGQFNEDFCHYLSELIYILESKVPTELCMYCETNKVKYFEIKKPSSFYICSPLFAYCEDCIHKVKRTNRVKILELNFHNFAECEMDEHYGREFRRDLIYLFHWAYQLSDSDDDNAHIGRRIARKFLYGKERPSF